MNYYFFYGPSIKKILSRYADLTGHMPMPPMWALGNQQSRWSYYPDTMVDEVVRQYRERDLPLDVIHLDIDYMQGYRVFTFDTSRFRNPKALERKTSSAGHQADYDCRSGREAPAASEKRTADNISEPCIGAARPALLRVRSGTPKELFSATKKWRLVRSESMARRKRFC